MQNIFCRAFALIHRWGEQSVRSDVRLGAGKAARFNVSTQSTGGFDRLLPHPERDLPLPETPKGTILTRNDPEIRECRLNQN